MVYCGMASKKILSSDHIMETFLSEDSEDNSIPGSDSSDSSGSERPEPREIALISDLSDETTPEMTPSYCPPLPPFTANVRLNIEIMSFVNSSFANNYLQYICEQTNVYVSQVIIAGSQIKKAGWDIWTS
jgi:hypothetical protein